VKSGPPTPRRCDPENLAEITPSRRPATERRALGCVRTTFKLSSAGVHQTGLEGASCLLARPRLSACANLNQPNLIPTKQRHAEKNG
jgi:hypothetical protein